MLEALLNIAWLVVSLGAVWLWRYRWTLSRRDPRHSTKMEAVAMVCALALLFPVISLTDDLHPEIIAVDAASGKRNACLIAASAPHVRAATVSSGIRTAVGVISTPLAGINLSSAAIAPLSKPFDPDSLGNTSAGRSPPILR